MYMIDSIRQKVENNEIIVGANVVLCDPDVSELFGFAGCDYVWIDLEHSSMSYKSVEQHIIGCHASNTAAFVRIPWNDQVMAKRVLDMGPDGIIIPLIRSYEEAVEAIRACSYPPNGVRGWNPIRALQYGCINQNWYVENADRLVWKILMIEHIAAVNDLDRILSIPGVDAIIIGPSDLTGSMGKLHETNTEEYWCVIEKITDIARKHHVVIGAAVPTNCSSGILNKWLSYGVQMLSIGQDAFLLSTITKLNVEAARKHYAEYTREVQ